MNDRPLEEYSLPYLWKRIEELKALLDEIAEAAAHPSTWTESDFMDVVKNILVKREQKDE